MPDLTWWDYVWYTVVGAGLFVLAYILIRTISSAIFQSYFEWKDWFHKKRDE